MEMLGNFTHVLLASRLSAVLASLVYCHFDGSKAQRYLNSILCVFRKLVL